MAAPPKKLKPVHLTMAALVATGLNDKEVAARLDMSHHTVKVTRQSPLFQLEVRRLQNKQTERISNNYVDQIMEDGERNVRFLKSVRDGKPFEDPNAVDAVRVRMDASKTLFDRQAPKKTEQDTQPVINITLQHNEQKIIADSLRDIGQQIPQLDDVIAEYEAQERDAAAQAD